jgi:hypothetical protein
MRFAFLAGLCFLLTALGCENAAPPQPVPTTATTPVSAPTPPVDATATAPTSETAPTGVADALPTDAVPTAPPPADAAASPPPSEPSPVREKAEAGVGVRGDTLGEGILHTPARAYFQTRERLVFLQVEQALQLYKGTEGRLPQTHDEFMQKIIQANNIQLPELQQGSKYVWDAEKGELMVQRPR